MKNVNLEKGIIYPETAKGGKAIGLELKKPTLVMLKDIADRNPKINERIFPHTRRISHVWCRVKTEQSKN